jgi:hypothetical protein
MTDTKSNRFYVPAMMDAGGIVHIWLDQLHPQVILQFPNDIQIEVFAADQVGQSFKSSPRKT